MIIASVSGGKDSTALALHLREEGIEFTPVFLDTRTYFSWKDKKHPDPRAPIGEFVAWAKTAHGGTDYEAYDPDAVAREGCMRWGLCATEPEAGESSTKEKTNVR